MGKELEPTKDDARKRWQEAGIEAIKQGAIPVAGMLADLVLPGSGLLVNVGFGMVVGAWSAYSAEKAKDAFSEVLKRLDERVKEVEDTQVTLEFIFSDEYLLELRRTLELIGKIDDKEKVEAAINYVVQVGVNGGELDRNLREHAAAFIRDATVLDLRVLAALPADGEYVTYPYPELSDAVLQIIFEHLTKVVGLSDQVGTGLLTGAVGHLQTSGLCLAVATFGGQLRPIQRTPLGERVLQIISQS